MTAQPAAAARLAPARSLELDPALATRRIADTLRRQLTETLKRMGFVVPISGGIDSAVCAALAARAVGARRVLGLLLPGRESDPRSVPLAHEWAGRLGIETLVEDITPILEAAGCYRRRDEAIRRVVPDYGGGWRCKVVRPRRRFDADHLDVHYLVVQPPGDEERRVRLPPTEYREIVAATSFKQRVRTMLAYHHADRLHYAVLGTPNRLEYDQGFFVKGGDGLADVKPIAHLYKTQVYRLAEHLGVPAAIVERPPTTDTYTLPQTQEEFYFSLPLATLDVVLHARNAGREPAAVAAELDCPVDRIERAYRDIGRRRAATRPLHLDGLLVEPVPEID